MAFGKLGNSRSFQFRSAMLRQEIHGGDVSVNEEFITVRGSGFIPSAGDEMARTRCT